MIATGAPARPDHSEPAPADEATLTPVKAGQASQQGGEGGEDAPALSADTNEPEAPADQSQEQPTDVSARLRASLAGAEGDADRQPISSALTQALDDEASNPGLTGGEGAQPAVPANSRRIMSMTPMEPRTAGGLKGFGFTVKFDDVHEPVQPVEESGTTIPHHGTVRA